MSKWNCKGSSPDEIKEGTRVRYYPARGINVNMDGRARMKPCNGPNGWVVHVYLDSGRTVYSAHLEHLDVLDENPYPGSEAYHNYGYDPS